MARRSARDARPRRGVSVWLTMLLMVLALFAGMGIDRFVLGSATGGTLGGKLALSEGDLDATLATYTASGKTVKVTPRDVFEHEGTLASSQNGDGSYDTPTADAVLATVRGQVIANDAKKQGITVGDDDVLAYAEATLGTRDLASVAAAYGQPEETVHAQLTEAALMARLRDQVVSATFPEAPAMPDAPGEAEEVTLLPGYGTYIIALAGDEWDAASNTWRDAGSPFASALSDYEVSAAGATYEAALQAYWVAYQAYASAHAEVASAWTDYVNGLLGDVSVKLSTATV